MFKKILQNFGFGNSKNFSTSGELWFITKILSQIQGALALDVGANKGDFSKELLKYTDHYVVAVEPLQLLQSELDEIALTHPNRFSYHLTALSSFNGEVDIHLNAAQSAHSSLHENLNELHYVSNTSREAVKVMTMETFLTPILIEHQSNLEFIKLDTEGSEYEIIKSSVDFLKLVNPSFIQVEFGQPNLVLGKSLLDFHRLLPEYFIYRLLPKSFIRVDPYDPISNIFLYSNYVFVNPKTLHKFDSFFR